MNMVDIVVIILFAAIILDGGRVGCVRTVFSTIKMIIGVLLSVFMCSLFMKSNFEEMRHVIPIVFFVIYGVVFGILVAVERLLNLVSKIPVAHEINKIVGIVAGALKGIVLVWIIFSIAGFYADTEWGKQICDIIYSSSILTWIDEFNPISLLFVKQSIDIIPEIPTGFTQSTT